MHASETSETSRASEYRPTRTPKFLTRYEAARLLGLRVLQLQEGPGVENPWRTAMEELRTKNNPAIIRRHLPDGSFEDVAASELRLDRHLVDYHLSEPLS